MSTVSAKHSFDQIVRLYDKSIHRLVPTNAAGLKPIFTGVEYHKPTDEYDENADYRGVVQDLELLVEVGLAVANGDTWPSWYPKSEFRAVRDASMAAKQ